MPTFIPGHSRYKNPLALFPLTLNHLQIPRSPATHNSSTSPAIVSVGRIISVATIADTALRKPKKIGFLCQKKIIPASFQNRQYLAIQARRKGFRGGALLDALEGFRRTGCASAATLEQPRERLKGLRSTTESAACWQTAYFVLAVLLQGTVPRRRIQDSQGPMPSWYRPG